MASASLQDIYRLPVVRQGVFDVNDRAYTATPSASATLTSRGRMLYLELAPELELMTKSTPASIVNTQGMRLNPIIFHVWTRWGTDSGIKRSNHALHYTDKISAGVPINWEQISMSGTETVPNLDKWYTESDFDFDQSKSYAQYKDLKYRNARYEDELIQPMLDKLLNKALVLRSYMLSTSATLDSINGTTFMAYTQAAAEQYRPYVEVRYSTVIPKVINMVPTDGGYADPHNGQRIRWDMYYDARSVIGAVTQKSATIRLRISGQEDYTEYLVQGAQSYFDVPDSWLTSDFDYQIMATTMHDMESSWCDWQALTITDGTSKPIPSNPVNMYVDATRDNTFAWAHYTINGTAQIGYELQVYDGETWTTIAQDATSDTQYYVVDANTLGKSVTKWRVRTGNSDGVVGDWSNDADIVVQTAPIISDVSATGNTIPTVHWEVTNDQQGYEISIDGEELGVEYGAEARSYTVDRILPDGDHAIGVRAVSTYGIWGDWRTTTHAVQNVPSTMPPLMAQANVNDVELTWVAPSSARCIVYRDGEQIADGATSPYTDHEATGRHAYSVRIVDADGNYTDSISVPASPTFRDALIAQHGKWSWVRLAAASSTPTLKTAIAPVYSLNYYSGRELPVMEMSSHKSVAHSTEYNVFDPSEAQAVMAMLGRNVCFKRAGGEIHNGVLTACNCTRAYWGYTLALTITEVAADA